MRSLQKYWHRAKIQLQLDSPAIVSGMTSLVAAATIIWCHFAQECKQIVQIDRFVALLMGHIAVNVAVWLIQFVIDLMGDFR